MIIFFGDSITRDWPLRAVVPEGPVDNAGIGGETTGEMVWRFERDVLARRPTLVHLLAGINDIAENRGPVPTAAVADNLFAMIDAARRRGIAVVAGLLLPCTTVRKRPHLQPQPAILDLNTRLRAIARGRAWVADYFAPLVDEAGGLRADCTTDGLHLNGRGYATIGPVAQKVIAQALG